MTAYGIPLEDTTSFPSLSTGATQFRVDERRRTPRGAALVLLAGMTAIQFAGPIHPALRAQSETAKTFMQSGNGIQQIDRARPDIRLTKRIRELGTYPRGWDGADAKPAMQKTVQEAEMFMRRLLGARISEPHIALATDGEINMLWDLGEFEFDLGFFGDGTYAYYGKTNTGQEFTSDSSDVTEPLPDRILELLRS